MVLESFLFLSFLISLFLYFAHERLKYFQLFSNLGIPGPAPNLFFGNMMELMGNGKLPTEVMQEWEMKYGPYYGFFRGTRPVLVLRDPELIKDILVKNSGNFINRPEMIMNIPPLPHTVVGLRNKRWREVRQILSPTYSSAKVKQMFPIMSNCVNTTLTILEEKSKLHQHNHTPWAQHPGNNFKEGQRAVETLDAHKLFQELACDVISGCALAMKVNSQRDPNDKFLIAVKGFLENAMGPFVKLALCFPLLAKWMEWAMLTFGYAHEMTRMIIASVKTSMVVRRERKVEIVDALQLMMDSKLPNSNEKALSDKEIVANAWVFVLGGFETTSAALSYTCYLLSTHQDIQERLFKELKENFALEELPTYDKLGELTFLDQVICESLRLYPPVIGFVVRGLEKESWIGDRLIPQNVGIQIPVWQIHHDSKIWPEPYKFDPDRFSNNAKKAFGNNMDWIPFGAGPRSCIGLRFAMINLKFTLSSILRKFTIVPGSDFIPFKLKLKVPSVTIVPDGGIPLRFLPRTE